VRGRAKERMKFGGGNAVDPTSSLPEMRWRGMLARDRYEVGEGRKQGVKRASQSETLGTAPAPPRSSAKWRRAKTADI
jgi:hypothetical protein